MCENPGGAMAPLADAHDYTYFDNLKKRNSYEPDKVGVVIIKKRHLNFLSKP